MALRKLPCCFSDFAQLLKGRKHSAQAKDLPIFIDAIWLPAGLLLAAVCCLFQSHAANSPTHPAVGGSSAAVNPELEFPDNRLTPCDMLLGFVSPYKGHRQDISSPTLANAAILDELTAFAKLRRFR